MMIHIPELVLSVMGKITRLGVSPRRVFFFLRIAGPTRRPEKKGREAPRTEGRRWKSEKKRNVMGKGFERGENSVSQMVGEAFNFFQIRILKLRSSYLRYEK